MPYRTFDVERAHGKSLRVGQWGDGPSVVVALHGLTASHLAFAALADQLPEVTILAPDLRGRGCSRDVGGPYAMEVHVDDVVAVLDAAGVERATVVGHSMGGFVAVVAADRAPERVRDLVLVDGGVALPLDALADVPVEELVRAVTGPALDRLRMSFGSTEEYLDFWRSHPALAADWNAYAERMYRYDLVGEPPRLRSAVLEEAVIEDSASELRSGVIDAALGRLAHPAVLVRAPLGMFNQEPPLYPDSVVVAARQQVPHLEDVVVPGVNHYTILLAERGARAVAGIVRDRLARLGQDPFAPGGPDRRPRYGGRIMGAESQSSDDLLRLLELEQLDTDLYRGINELSSRRPSLYGGQVAAQALRAAALTVPEGRLPHSFHGYFLRPGRIDRPVILKVDRERDGRSFSARHVVAVQNAEVIFSMSASFHASRAGAEWSAPEMGAPLSEESDEGSRSAVMTSALLVRTLPPKVPYRHGEPPLPARMWVKTPSPLPDDPVLHACVLAYASDLGGGFGEGTVPGASRGGPSIDHAVWFHGGVRMDDWVRLDTWPLKLGGGRGLYAGSMQDRSGRLVAMLMQEQIVPEEGVVLVRRPEAV